MECIILKEHDISKAICNNCQALVNTTYKIRSVPFSNGYPPVNILAGVCDICDKTVAIPAQSTKIIKKHREKYEQN